MGGGVKCQSNNDVIICQLCKGRPKGTGMEVLTGQNSGREVTRSDKNVVENEETSTNEKSIGNI